MPGHKPISLVRISIHALREEGDPGGSRGYPGGVVFLSTPSARRATRRDKHIADVKRISIHALREEGDLKADNGGYCLPVFLSTPSARRATEPASRT